MPRRSHHRVSVSNVLPIGFDSRVGKLVNSLSCRGFGACSQSRNRDVSFALYPGSARRISSLQQV